VVKQLPEKCAFIVKIWQKHYYSFNGITISKQIILYQRGGWELGTGLALVGVKYPLLPA